MCKKYRFDLLSDGKFQRWSGHFKSLKKAGQWLLENDLFHLEQHPNAKFALLEKGKVRKIFSKSRIKELVEKTKIRNEKQIVIRLYDI